MLSCSYSSIQQKQVTEYVHASLSMSSGRNVYLSHQQSCRAMPVCAGDDIHMTGLLRFDLNFYLLVNHQTPGGCFQKTFPNLGLVFLKLNKKAKTET